MTHPAQTAKRTRRQLHERYRKLKAFNDLTRMVEAQRCYECILKRTNPKRWLALQRLVTQQLQPTHQRTGYASMSTWNQ